MNIEGHAGRMRQAVEALAQLLLGYADLNSIASYDSDTGRTWQRVLTVSGITMDWKLDEESMWERLMLMAEDRLKEMRSGEWHHYEATTI